MAFSSHAGGGRHHHTYCHLHYPGFCSLANQQHQDALSEWRNMQEEMLRSYLATAESDLRAKQELVDVKQQRLHLAQDDLNHLKSTLSMLSASTASRKSSINILEILYSMVSDPK